MTTFINSIEHARAIRAFDYRMLNADLEYEEIKLQYKVEVCEKADVLTI